MYNITYIIYCTCLCLIALLFPDREDFSRAVDDGVLGHYLTSYSRSEASDVCYVQDNLRKHGEHLSHLIMKMNAVVYVCG